MRTWSLRVLRQSLRLVLSALYMSAAATSVAFKSRTALHLENLVMVDNSIVLKAQVILLPGPKGVETTLSAEFRAT